MAFPCFTTKLKNSRHHSHNNKMFFSDSVDQEYPASPTPDRPSTITEVTEHSSGDIQDREKRTSGSSEDFSTDPIIQHRERKRWESRNDFLSNNHHILQSETQLEIESFCL